MKLMHQINLAFGLLLIAVLGGTTVLIHFVLMDHFITKQREELRSIGTEIASTLSDQGGDSIFTLAKGEGSSLQLWEPALAGGVQVFLSDTQGKVFQEVKLGRSESNDNADETATNSLSPVKMEDIAKSGEAAGYLVNVSAVPQGKLTLMTPLSQIKEVEQDLFVRLLIVLGAGGVLALLFSLLITRKLIRPLMKLREELKKVRERQFGEVGLVKAGGEIGAVAQTVYELAGELERHNRAQKQFFQNASHELKTPLMSIAGYAEGIRDGVFEGDDSRKGLEIIMSESGRLTKIVTEMTLLAKLDSEEDIYHPSAFPVREIVAETSERINPLLVAKGLELHTVYREETEEELMCVSADRDKLLQALLNIVSNATRYANSVITIEVGMENSRVSLTVADDGKGFPDNLLPHIFHRFVKGKDGETGLGLAISRAIVERCGGRITALNRSTGGAAVSLSLPIV